jgi:hypothetical protein
LREREPFFPSLVYQPIAVWEGTKGRARGCVGYLGFPPHLNPLPLGERKTEISLTAAYGGMGGNKREGEITLQPPVSPLSGGQIHIVPLLRGTIGGSQFIKCISRF